MAEIHTGFEATGDIDMETHDLQAVGATDFSVEVVTLNAAGAIVVSKSYVKVDTFGGAAADDLVSISGLAQGAILILSQVASARDVTVKDGATIRLAGSVDFTLRSVYGILVLQHRSANIYVELSRSQN